MCFPDNVSWRIHRSTRERVSFLIYPFCLQSTLCRHDFIARSLPCWCILGRTFCVVSGRVLSYLCELHIIHSRLRKLFFIFPHSASDHYHLQIFAPLFFASIGYSIPFTSLWTGRIIWRGILYSLLMMLGKFLVGLTILASDASHPPPSLEILPVESFATLPTSVSSALSEKSPPKKKAGRFHLPTRGSYAPAFLLGSALIARGEIGVSLLYPLQMILI